MTAYQTIVVGLGAMGSAAVYQLSKRGGKVLGIDQFVPPHAQGSTHGETRVTRQAIGEGAAYTPLALRSHEIWKELEARSGQPLLSSTGMLIMSKSDSASPMHGRANFLAQTLESAEKYGISYEILGSSEIRRRFPQFKVRDCEQGYLEHLAGFLRPEKCVEAQLSLAQEQGAQIQLQEKVLEFVPDGAGVRVRTDKGEYTADNLVVSAGPWISGFLKPEFQHLFQVYRQLQYWFAPDCPDRFAPDRFPVFIWDLGLSNGFGIYGFPALSGGQGGMKIAKEEYNSTTTPEQANRSVSDQEKQRMYEQWVEPYIEGVSRECLRASACFYTMTPDSDFIIDRHPEHSQVIVASPCSGHGFKHSAAIGEILADLATDGKSRLDISNFSLTRFL